MNELALPKNVASDDAWDEGSLGRDPAYAKRVPISAAHRAKLDEKLHLQAISIRLPDALLADLKAIAKVNGLGYQPLIRQVLTRFAHAELKAFAREALGATETTVERNSGSDEADSAPDEPTQRRAA